MSIETKKRMNTTIDLILLVIFLISVLYFIAEMFIGSLLPRGIMFGICVVLFAIFFLFFLTTIKQTKISWMRRTLIVLFSICLLFASFYQLRIRKAFNEVDVTQTGINHLSLVVHSDSKMTELEELDGLRIGFINSDEANNLYAQKEIERNSSIDVEYVMYASYQDCAIDLMNQRVEAVVVNDVNYSIMKDMYVDFYEHTSIIKEFRRSVTINELATEKNLLTEPFTIFISGMDQLGYSNVTSKSDSNVLVMVDPKRHHIEMISLLRDTYIPNLAYNSYPDKLTHTGTSGIDNTVQSLEAVFGFDIDYYAKVSFSSVIEVVNTLGGVEANIPITFCEQDENRDFENQICLDEGEQVLNGSQALAFARHRHSYSDVERTMAQQEIIKGVFEGVLSVNGFSKIPDLLQVAAQYVSTNMKIEDMKAFIMNEIENPKQWSFGMTSLSDGMTSTQPCISWDPSWPLSVYLLSEHDLAVVYGKYLQMFDVIEFNHFAFDLNHLTIEEILPPANPNVVTVQNYQSKIAEFYSILPDHTIQPYVPSYRLNIVNEKTEKEVTLDIDAPIEDANKLSENID